MRTEKNERWGAGGGEGRGITFENLLFFLDT